MMRLAVDLDGTLARTAPRMLLDYNRDRGTSYTEEDITDYDAWTVPMLLDLNKDEFYRRMDGAWEDWVHIEPEPGAVTAMRVLNSLRRSLDLRIDIVTGRDTTPPEVLEAWLRANGVRYDRLVVDAGDKANLDYDFFIDDGPYVAEAIRKYPAKTLILHNKPWNQRVQETANVRRMTDWRQVLNKLGITFRADQVAAFGHGDVPVRQHPRRAP